MSFDWQLILPFSADTSSDPTLRDDDGVGGEGCSVSRWTGSAAPECLEKEHFSFFFALGKKTVSLRLNCFSHFTSVLSCFRVASL